MIEGFKKFLSAMLVDKDGSAVSSSNPLPVSAPDGLEVSGTATSAAVLFTTSMLNYESITVQVMSAGTGCTISYETSDDNVVWVACSGLNASNTGYGLLLATSSTTGMSQFARKGLDRKSTRLNSSHRL